MKLAKFRRLMDLTRLLQRAKDGDERARADLLRVAYAELRRLASACMRQQRPDHTLSATALVHEVSLKFLSSGQVSAANRSQFLGYMAKTMRNVLIDHARTRGSQKRAGRSFSSTRH